MSKKQKNKKRLWIELLYFLSIFIIAFFGIKIILILITTPILVNYAAAYDWYSITNDPSYFKKASDFVKSWFVTLISFVAGIILLKLIKIKKDKE